jgi:hypothetical protein
MNFELSITKAMLELFELYLVAVKAAL